VTPLVPMQWTTAILGVVIAGIIVALVRSDQIHIRHSVWWLIVAAGSVILGFFPRIMDVVGLLLGVHYPPILFHTLVLGMILIKVLTMDIERSRQERALRRLTQRMAILETELERIGGNKITPED
jgi:hypothetical protein